MTSEAVWGDPSCPPVSGSDPRPSDAGAARPPRSRSIVLLANDDILPIEPSRCRRIAVLGPCGHPAVIGGGGSACNEPWRAVSIADGIRAVVPDAEEDPPAGAVREGDELPRKGGGERLLVLEHRAFPRGRTATSAPGSRRARRR